jgi:hypothetical protein
MHRTAIAATLALALAGTPVVATATASTGVKDPIAHMAAHHPGGNGHHYVNPLSHPGNPYVNPLGGGNAYGRDCAGESRQHVAGHPGTPFSECVRALSQLATGQGHSPAQACKAESHRHVKGHRGTPFSRCVAAAKKLERHARRMHAHRR